MSMITVYGIPNCDTIKKTLDWFRKNKVEYVFHDYKKSGITKEKLNSWSSELGWERVLNKKSTTWRELEKAEQQKITSQDAAVKLMIRQTSIIKRPLVEYAGGLLVGYNEKEFIQQLKHT